MADTTEARYYDVETGKPTLAATDAVLKCTGTPMRDKANVADAISELARLQRERDEARAQMDEAAVELCAACSASPRLSFKELVMLASTMLPQVNATLLHSLKERDTERAAREKAEGEKANASETMLEEMRLHSRTIRERDEALSTLATLRAELRQARRRGAVMRAGVLPDPSHSDDKRWTLRVVSCWSHTDARLAALNKTLYDQPFTSPEAALDAAWDALHAAGLVTDDEVDHA